MKMTYFSNIVEILHFEEMKCKIGLFAVFLILGKIDFEPNPSYNRIFPINNASDMNDKM